MKFIWYLKHINYNELRNRKGGQTISIFYILCKNLTYYFKYSIIQIGETLKERLEELKKISSEKQKVALQKVIDDLKLNQKMMKDKIDKQVLKLNKAFPSIQSEHIKEYVKLKVKEIKNKKKE